MIRPAVAALELQVFDELSRARSYLQGRPDDHRLRQRVGRLQRYHAALFALVFSLSQG